MNPAKSSLQQAFALSATALVGVGTALFASGAEAATFELDFDTNGLNGEGTALDARLMDGVGQDVEGTTYSTTTGNIGSIWADYGISITALFDDAAGDAPLGLFNSNCKPRGGTSASGFTDPCEIKINGKSFGDNDLATGVGSYKKGQIAYDTAPQGNLLIFEENVGNAAPDDTAGGGTILFEIADNKRWAIESIGLVDDASGLITYTYRDGSSSSEEISVLDENELKFFTGAQAKEIAKIAVQFTDSAGISGLRFREMDKPRPKIPEPSALVGLLAVSGVAARFKPHKA